MTDKSLDSYSPYTDLALEAQAAIRGRVREDIPGVRVVEDAHGPANITRVEITSPEGAQAIGKAEGTYVTIDCPALRHSGRELQEDVARVLERELGLILGLEAATQVLVVGLGNWNATPDALGPKVVSHLLVTRHLRDYVPQELKGKLRSVAAIAPGVLGLTGIETGEVIGGLVDRMQPDLLICIDALAARSTNRLGTTIQLSDSGIHPGSGVGNARPAINKEQMGIPVIALGVPTVVHAATVAHDAIDLLLGHLRQQNGELAGVLSQMNENEKRQLIAEVLHPTVGDMVVTPKEIDDLISDMARLIAGALNAVLHAGIGSDELARYLD